MEIKKSESISAVATALIEFHNMLGNVGKDSKNPFFKSEYASLSNILKGIKEPLIKANLSFVQFPVGENGMTTVLMHKSGEWIEGTYFMKPMSAKPHYAGSVITYQRRYALGAILGINIDNDDDGNVASTESKGKPEVEQPQEISKADALKEEVISAVQAKFFGSKAAFDAWKNEKNVTKPIKDMTESELNNFLDLLNNDED